MRRVIAFTAGAAALTYYTLEASGRGFLPPEFHTAAAAFFVAGGFFTLAIAVLIRD
jgi:hypothetical protein